MCLFTGEKVMLTHGVPDDWSWEGGRCLEIIWSQSLSENISIKISISHNAGIKFNEQTGALGFDEWIDGWLKRWLDRWSGK